MVAFVDRISSISSFVHVVMSEQRFIALQTCLWVFESV